MKALLNDQILFEMDNIYLGLYRFNDRIYNVTSIEAIWARVIELKIEDKQETEYEHNLKCPYCGYEDNDSWELYDNDDDFECGRCGALMQYERIVTIEYSAKIVKKPTIIDVEE